MIANQTLVASDGYEVALFPLEYLFMTQDEGGDYSHYGTYNIDFVGYNGSSVINQAPLYAPVTMRLISYMPEYNNGNGEIWVSTNPVHLANGQLDYLSIWVVHCNNPPYTSIGTVVNQGQLFYRTGDYGYATGDHVHICVGQGQNPYLVRRASGNTDLSNRIHMWDGLYVNNTPIIQGYGHDWKEYTAPVIPPKVWGKGKKDKFPFPIAWASWGYR
ncbi:MAG: hypothetical protein J6R32_00310 [Bacteroidales bacterium]|nr:hypothetical protein [Bacteroidales bacterium]